MGGWGGVWGWGGRGRWAGDGAQCRTCWPFALGAGVKLGGRWTGQGRGADLSACWYPMDPSAGPWSDRSTGRWGLASEWLHSGSCQETVVRTALRLPHLATQAACTSCSGRTGGLCRCARVGAAYARAATGAAGISLRVPALSTPGFSVCWPVHAAPAPAPTWVHRNQSGAEHHLQLGCHFGGCQGIAVQVGLQGGGGHRAGARGGRPRDCSFMSRPACITCRRRRVHSAGAVGAWAR